MTKKKAKKVAKKTVKAAKKTRAGRWPQERKVLYRPDRYKYIASQRKRTHGDGPCVFCESLSEGIGLESLLLYTTPQAMVVLNKFPYNPGHLMVLPRRHEGDMLKLSDTEYEEVMRLIRASVKVLKQAYTGCDLNVGINLGRAAGAGIPEHMHVHIIPRWLGDSNFFPVIAETKVLPTDMQTVFNTLKPLFEKVGGEGI